MEPVQVESLILISKKRVLCLRRSMTSAQQPESWAFSSLIIIIILSRLFTCQTQTYTPSSLYRCAHATYLKYKCISNSIQMGEYVLDLFSLYNSI